ncbi:MFS general substrate transporter [Clavulina sp. PMI_390]|nr:MFS general substrate transporter [Clavulina sp. PMI_390]
MAAPKDVEANLEPVGQPSQTSTVIDSAEMKREGSGTGTSVTASVPEKSVEPPSKWDPAFQVSWDGPDDPSNPQNWPTWQRWYHVVWATMLSIMGSIASSSPTGIFRDLEKAFTFSSEIGTLLISVFLIGFTVGPMVWAPASEVYGRRPTFLYSAIIFTGFQIGCALAKNTGEMIVFRLISGAAAIGPLTNTAAVVNDVMAPKERAGALGVFMLAALVGPSIGPVIAGFIHNAGVDWRWMFWSLSIFGGIMCTITAVTFKETYPPFLLGRKAAQKRKETGDDRWYAPIETRQVPMAQTVANILIKPWKIFFMEPILIAINIYVAFQYGLLYLNFQSYPIVFQYEKHYSAGVGALPFLGILVGGVLAIGVMLVFYAPMYMRAAKAAYPKRPPPEAWLPQAQLGAVCFAVSLFIFGWTSYPNLSWAGPTIAGGLFAFGLASLFIPLTGYIIDAYAQVAASALASNVILRSFSAAGLPLFARQMYTKMTPRWASTLLGFIALAMLPIPWLLIRYGPYLRSKSRYVPNKD